MLSKGAFARFYGGPNVVRRLNDKGGSLVWWVNIFDNFSLQILKHFHCSPIYVTLCLLYQLCFIVFKQFKMRKINNQNIATRSGIYPLDIDNSIICSKSCFRVLPATDILHSGVGYEECIQLDNSRWMMKANDEFDEFTSFNSSIHHNHGCLPNSVPLLQYWQ